jgi:hypothetical protein
MIGDIGAGIGGSIASIAVLAGAAGKGGERERKKLVELWTKLQLPNYDLRALDPEELQLVAEYFPNVYEAHIPDEVKTVQDSPELRNAQMRGLSYLERVRDEGLPLEENLAAQEAQRSLAQGSRRIQEGAVRNLQERGRAGGGAEVAARMMGAQQSNELARGMGTDLARQAVMNRLQAASTAGNLAGDIRAQDVNVSGQQADAVNRFNQWVSQLKTGAAQYGADARNQAQGYNVGTKQRVADVNTMNRQEMAQRNQEYSNAMRNQGFSDQLKRLAGLSDAYQGLGQYKDAQQAARAKAIYSLGQGVGRAAGGAFGGF